MLDNVVHFDGDRDTRDMMSDAKFFEGYSRWDDEKNRYETWDEAVKRVMNMHRNFYKDKMTPELSTLIDEAEDLYKKKYFLGAQRALQFGGDQLIKHQMRLYNCTSTYADRVEFFGEFFYVLLCGAGAGVSVQKHHIAKLPKIQNRTKQAKIHTVTDDIEGWGTAADALMSSYFVGGGKYPEYEGRRVYFDTSSIREKGAMISGGFKAPGPEPLRRALDKIEHLLQGLVLKGITQLSPIHVYDISMHLADAVLAGGVRRSATIFLFSPDDEEMMKAKTGNWFAENPQRGRSNNSAVIVRGAADREQFHNLMQSVREFGEPGFVFVESTEHTYNPCVTGDTMVKVKDHDITENGEIIGKGVEYELPIEELKRRYIEFKDRGGHLYDYMPLALSYNVQTGVSEYKQILWAEKTRINSEVIKIVLDNGKTLKCTPDHKIFTRNRGYVEAKDLIDEDDIVVV
jgi:ribonucleoside-diphosphate reductase alpha chain